MSLAVEHLHMVLNSVVFK